MDSMNEIIALPSCQRLLQAAQTSRDCKTLIKVALQALESAFPTFEIKREGKSCEESEKLRKLADDLCVKKKGRIDALVEACEMYSQSISKAEKSSAALAQAYANRSACLFNLNKHDACVRDINRALANGYPDQKKDNLIRRRAKSLKILGITEPDDFCERTRKCLDDMSLNERTMDAFGEENDSETSKISINQHWNGNTSKFVSHPKFPVASDAIDMNMMHLLPLSLKITISAIRKTGSISKLREELSKVPNCRDDAQKLMFDRMTQKNEEYLTLYSLLTHEENRNQREIFAISVRTAFAMYFIFRLTSFFGDLTLTETFSDLYNDDDAIFVGVLIAKHQMIIPTNVYGFTELQNNEQIKIGEVLGTMTSLLNHSCNPNVSRCSTFKNNYPHQMTYALQPIKKGATLLNDYGCHFTFNSKPEREKYLKNFYFKCCCSACDNSWPLYKDMPTVLFNVAEYRERVEISRAIIRSKKYEKLILEGALAKFQGKKELILKDLAHSIATIFMHTEKPSKEYHNLLDLFRHAFSQVYGNVLILSPI
ncbi:hypothetical protein QAD02_015529 [Eretmocerus hayati]|uniref:Uncharacterized protein n=1 Tax=Eretmocerus hayati TaxID=131215 RepID=A0ACC2P8I6_9HYME|nr:hypothetical protein QAD02_015529 [Eretmocerus hayati]